MPSLERQLDDLEDRVRELERQLDGLQDLNHRIKSLELSQRISDALRNSGETCHFGSLPCNHSSTSRRISRPIGSSSSKFISRPM
jgi:hypothetical protein